MISADNQDVHSRETVYDSSEGWTTTAGFGSELFLFYLKNTSKIASYAYGALSSNEAFSPFTVSSATARSDGVTGINEFVYLDSVSTEDAFPFTETNFPALSTTNSYENDTTGNSTSLRDNFSSPYLMPWPQRSAWIAVFTLLVFVAAVGNALVAWIVFAHKRMKTVTNYFLVNLSLADLTMTLFNCIFNFTFMLNSHWPFGGFYCTVNNFVANVTVAASVFTLVAISFDRYIAIVYPLRPRMSKSTARITISLIWFASCILAVPCLLYSTTISHSYPDGEIRVVCIFVWPDGVPSVSQQDFIYNIVFTVSTYLIPVIVMGACYSRMSYVLWRSKSIGELNQRQAESIQSKRKVVRMFMVVVTLFVVCWLPYHGYFVYQFIDDQVISYKHVQHIFLSFYWLAMSNTMINPLVYYYMNTRFREHFRTVLCQCLCCRSRSASTMNSLSGAAIIITRASQRTGPILRNDRADFLTGPRPPQMVPHARHYGTSGQQNGANNLPVDVTHLSPDGTLSVRRSSEERQHHLHHLRGVGYNKNGLDSHQHVVVSNDSNSSNTTTWISTHGQLVTVWTPSLLSPITRDNIRSMNRNNTRKQMRRNSTDHLGCESFTKDYRATAETKT